LLAIPKMASVDGLQFVRFPSWLPSKLRGFWLLPRWDCLPLDAPAFAGRTDARGSTCSRAPPRSAIGAPLSRSGLEWRRRDGVAAPILARAAAPWRRPFKASARRRAGTSAAKFVTSLPARVPALGRAPRVTCATVSLS